MIKMRTLQACCRAQGIETLVCSHRTAKAILRTGFLCVVKKCKFLTVGFLSSRWILSKAKKDDTDDEIAKYDGKSYPYFD